MPLSEVENNSYSFEDLRVHYMTGRPEYVSGVGRNRVFNYRNGVMTNIGELEYSEWMVLAQKTIQNHNEQELFSCILEWTQMTTYNYTTKREIFRKALESHMSRLFDNPKWVYFVKFNQLYRPEFLITFRLISVVTDCCGVPGQVTQELLHLGQACDGRIPCPICGRYSKYSIAPTNENGED